jgi:hypothetical protein
MRLLYSATERARMVASNRPSEPTAEATAKALEKASEGGRWAGVRFNPASGTWIVPSASNIGEYHTVSVRNVNVPANSWWQRLRCNCPAGKDGLAVCWHKAAVFIRREQQRRELKYYETATGLGPRLDDYRSYHSNDVGQGIMQPRPRHMALDEEGMGSAGPGTSGSTLDGNENV